MPKIRKIRDNFLQPRKMAQNWKNTKAIAFTFFQKWAKIWGILFMTDSDRKFDEDSENQEDFWRKRIVFEIWSKVCWFYYLYRPQDSLSWPIEPRVFFSCSETCLLSYHHVSWESDDYRFWTPINHGVKNVIILDCFETLLDHRKWSPENGKIYPGPIGCLEVSQSRL